MPHTPLHRLLGEPAGPLTDAMIDAAVAQGIAESDELDWKAVLPAQREFKQSDYIKDIAAFANAGGGMLVFGVKEEDKAAVERTDAGDFNENYERTIQQACMTAITPPVLGVRCYPVGAEPTRAVALVVPPSVDGPHLVFKGDQFAAPLRVGADTHWMREREIEAAYRARFDAARRSQHELQNLYDDMSQSFDVNERAVFVGSARPRVTPSLTERRDVADASLIMLKSSKLADWWLADPSGYHPLTDVSPYSSRAGLRGWVAPPTDDNSWRAARAAVFDDGSVSLAWRAGNHRHGPRGVHLEPWEVPVKALEGFVAALLALVHTTADLHGTSDMEVRVGVEWQPAFSGPMAHRISFVRSAFSHSESATPLAGGFRPLTVTVDPSAPAKEFVRTVVDLAADCVNQAGYKQPQVLDTNLPPRDARYKL